MTEEQKIQQTETALAVLKKHYQTLTSFKGVTGAGAGLKMVNNTFTDDIGIYIEVKQKLAESDLAPNQIIPKSMDGVTVDVVERPNIEEDVLEVHISEKVEDENMYRPLIGGSQITNGITDSGGYYSIGTLGCMVYLPNKKDPYTAILSNHHVLFARGGKEGTKVYQPNTKSIPIAELKHGRVIIEEDQKEVDYAIAKIESNIPFRNEVLQIGDLKGFRNAYVKQAVRKYGRTTRYTPGQIIKVGMRIEMGPGPIAVYTGLEIIYADPYPKPDEHFSKGGDSGSVIVDNDNYIVGLLWGSSKVVPKIAAANDQRRLHQVESGFKVPVPTTYQMQQVLTDKARLKKYQERLEQSAHGKNILNAFIRNIDEGIRLVNEQRECIVAWQRNKGPAFISIIKNLDQEKDYQFEHSIDGVLVENMAANMATLFKKYGSDSMSKAIEQYSDEVLSYIRQANTVEEIIEMIMTAEEA